MDYIRRFDIQLDREYVYPGQYLCGHVILDNRENMKIRNIRATLRGKAHVEWKVMKSGERRTVKDDQYFLDDKIVVWGKERTDESIPILPRGQHQLPFKFLLPEPSSQPMPCSFESKTGTIRYYVKVTIDIPYASPPQGIKYFTLVGPTIDCNEDKYLTPVIAQDIKVLCCLCCRKGPISLHCTLPRTAYCAGERLEFQADVNNQSNEAAQLRVQLFQIAKGLRFQDPHNAIGYFLGKGLCEHLYVEYFIDKGPLGISKDVCHLVMQMIGAEVEPDSTWKVGDEPENAKDRSKWIIPVVPPTLVGVCVIMKNSGEDLHMEFPLTIGTKPAREKATGIVPAITYETAADHVEGGLYISPEFQIGQVYDGTYGSGESDDVILYRPTYVKVGPPRPPVPSTSRGVNHNDIVAKIPAFVRK